MTHTTSRGARAATLTKATLTTATLTTLTIAGTTLAGPATQASSTTSPEVRAGVCAGVKHCHRVVTIDVDGDRKADRVGWHQLSKRRVQIRVRMATGKLLERKVSVRHWPGKGAWGGAARVDGRRGAELLIGSAMGAHTPQYTMLTYRKGRLTVEKSPRRSDGAGGRWAVDSALMVNLGWHRHVGRSGRIAMTYKEAWRNGKSNSFKGRNIQYTWTNGHWKRTNTFRRWYKTERAARKIGGWHVGRLKRFPGI